jgi:CIC family chloride channel protein
MKRFYSHLLSKINHHMPADKGLPLMVLAALVGVGGAFSAIIFRSAFVYAEYFFSDQGNGMVAVARSLPWWGRMFLPMFGGILAALLLKFGLHWVPRKGADDYLEAITIGDGVLSFRQTLIKSLSSLCSIGSGASIGREGSMVQLAAMLASQLGRVLKLSRSRLRLLVACGATADGIVIENHARAFGGGFGRCQYCDALCSGPRRGL